MEWQKGTFKSDTFSFTLWVYFFNFSWKCSSELEKLKPINDVQEFWEQLEHLQAVGSHQPPRC